MHKSFEALSVLSILSLLTGCSFSSSSQKVIQIKDPEATTKALSVYYNSLDKKESVNLCFYDDEQEIPYINIRDAFRIRKSLFDTGITYETPGKSKYWIENVANDFTVTLNDRATVDFDANNQTILISNLGLAQSYSYNTTPYDILCMDDTTSTDIHYVTHQKKADGDVKSYSYIGENTYIKLSDYNIRMYADGANCYIPLDLFNNFFVSYSYNNFCYNGDDIYCISSIETPTDEYLNDYYSGSNSKKSRSDDLRSFTYDSLRLNLDYQYGLKDLHGFSSYIDEFSYLGIYDSLHSFNDEEYLNAIYTIVYNMFGDGHCSFSKRSPYISKDTLDTVNKSFINYNIGISELNTNFRYALSKRDQVGKENPDYVKCYYEDGDTAYVRFDSFDQLNSIPDYYSTGTDGTETNIFGVINYANKKIKKNVAIKNVVVDLLTNGGGEEPALIFALGWLLGDDARVSVNNPLTHTNSTVYYHSDVNLDGKYDENDDTLKSYNKFILTSQNSYSCGNALPVFCKESQKVKIIGQKSGGGTCQVFPLILTDGTIIDISGGAMLAKETNSHYEDIDDGATPDYTITDVDKMFDRSYTTKVVHSFNL
jgi:hypothetical protein